MSRIHYRLTLWRNSTLHVCAVVTQLVEYDLAKVAVAGSNPVYCSQVKEMKMSKTRKDLSWSVLAKKEGVVSHDHTTGVCVTGTDAEINKQRAARNRHIKVCRRWTKSVECVHNGEREALQRRINHARAGDNSLSLLNLTHSHCSHESWVDSLWCEDGDISPRVKTSEEIAHMLEKGYLPNCDQVKTHTVLLEDIDLGLRPGEYAPNPRVWHRREAMSILLPQYDKSRKCRECEAYKQITCTIEPKYRPSSYQGCECCSYAKTEVLTKTRVRDRLRNELKEYNSGCSEED